jgi:uncharacterized protein (DUF488 family)
MPVFFTTASPRPTPAPGLVTIWTIGHSTLPLPDFLALLQSHHLRTLADVRTVPRSRHNPHFAQDALAPALEQAGIRYIHLPELGGLRKPRPDSRNTAWRNDSFRGYADYMETPAFAAGLDHLITIAAESPTAIMCAEALWWRCHRSLIADALKARGHTVLHIASSGAVEEHRYTTPATVTDGRLSYAPSDSLFPG